MLLATCDLLPRVPGVPGVFLGLGRDLGRLSMFSQIPKFMHLHVSARLRNQRDVWDPDSFRGAAHT